VRENSAFEVGGLGDRVRGVHLGRVW
jgi:hypothetical protein